MRTSSIKGFGDWVHLTLMLDGETIQTVTHLQHETADDYSWYWTQYGELPYPLQKGH